MSALVSVLVPCYRDAHLVERALSRLLHGSRCRLEVVLLNNDLDQVDVMRDLVVSLGDPRVRLLELEHRAGFAKAINVGIVATAGEFVLFANSDLFVAHGYLDELVSFFERCPRAGCASGKILRYDLTTYRETDVIDTTGLTIGRNRRVADRGENERDVGQFEREEEVFGVSGAALVARRVALQDVAESGEYLDESFHMYKEDVDLCWRLRLAGWECWYVPSAVAYHARTTRGRGDMRYLRGLRAFHENERRKPRHARINSMKNQWLLLVKNESARDFVRDLPFIAGREALVLGHNLVFAPRDTAAAAKDFIRAAPSARARRRLHGPNEWFSKTSVRSWVRP